MAAQVSAGATTRATTFSPIGGSCGLLVGGLIITEALLIISTNGATLAPGGAPEPPPSKWQQGSCGLREGKI